MTWARALVIGLLVVGLALAVSPARAADVEPLDGTMRTTRGANVRAEPRADSDRLATLQKGARIPVTGRLTETDWVRVTLPDGRTGYIWEGLLDDFRSVREIKGDGPPRPPSLPADRAPDRETADTADEEDAETTETAAGEMPADKDVAPRLVEPPEPPPSRRKAQAGEDTTPEPPAPPETDETAPDEDPEEETAEGAGDATEAAALPEPPGAPGAGDERAADLPPAGESFRDCPSCPEMVVVPAGGFTMGAREDQPGGPFERPAHDVEVPAPFAVSRTEITRRQWRACVEAGGCDGGMPRPVEGAAGADRPVARVSWHAAEAYAAWLTQRTDGTYRLPTEAQWEYAARAESQGVWPWGGESDEACTHANVFDQSVAANAHPGRRFDCNDGFPGPAPVGRFDANGWGLADVIGNVAEWVRDCPHNDYSETPTVATRAWTEDNCDLRIHRGGSWRSAVGASTLVARAAKTPESQSPAIGVRVVREPAE